jgi:hypothetical protein
MRHTDLTGQTFNRLTAIRHAGSDDAGRAKWECSCECGNVVVVKSAYLKRSDVKSCGCMGIEQRRKAAQTQCHALSRRSQPRARKSWGNMIARCTNPDNVGWKQYGGRGITVCERWLNSFASFFGDMGEPPAGHTIDRIDSNGPYSKENCRWATQKDQANNRTNNRLVTANGKTLTVSQWADLTGLSWHTIHARLSRGWSAERAVSESVRHRA